MPFFIFNDSTGKQRADFYESEISEDVLWRGESVSAFTAETGFGIDQLGGFVFVGGTLTFDQTLKDAHDAPQEAVQTLKEKRSILVQGFNALDQETQLQFQDVAMRVFNSLLVENKPLALANLNFAKQVEGVNVQLVDSMIDLLQQ